MKHNPDIYLLYEYMEKIPFTVRMKVCLDAPVDAALLTEAAQEAIGRFPYFSVRVGLDAEENYTLEHNDRPVAVLPEKDERLTLGSEDVNGHLIAITWRNNFVWFNYSHTFCGATGGLFWVKATLYLYMLKKYGPLEAPKDIKLPGTPVTEGELFFPNADELPDDEPISRYDGGDSNLALGRFLKYLLCPFAKENYYYQIDIPVKDFMEYAARIDGSPSTILTAMMYKVCSRLFREKKGTFIGGRIAADYRDDIGADASYRDFVRFIHVKYEWSMKDEPIQKLNMRARGAVIRQNQPELGIERFKKISANHREIDRQPDLEAKKAFALKNSTFRSDPRDNYTISYVGKTDWGGMDEHIQGFYSITDGDLMLELNALKDKFCITFQLINKDPRPLELFCEVLEQEGVPYRVSDRFTRHMPKIKLP
ncbi:MAG: hypothetical protein J6S60_10770 [Oscillospiraceae bacterium]|nr:hypothetical protein [Oscillospiraceae bacterium]